MKTTLMLSQPEIEKILARGGPTFRPLRRGRFQLVQLPEKGPLTRKQADWIRARVRPAHRQPPPKPEPIARPLFKRTTYEVLAGHRSRPVWW